jgi:hypothetical protein
VGGNLPPDARWLRPEMRPAENAINLIHTVPRARSGSFPGYAGGPQLTLWLPQVTACVTGTFGAHEGLCGSVVVNVQIKAAPRYYMVGVRVSHGYALKA